MWCKFFEQFEEGDYEAHKTLAHPSAKDIEAGKTTAWEMRGNGHADRLAKRGAAFHSIPEQIVGDYFGFMHLVKAAATWAGTHEAWLADGERWDSQSIEGMTEHAKQLPAPVVSAAVLEREGFVRSHKLVAADLQPRSEGWIIACSACGAFAWKRRGKLLEACPGRPTSKYMRQQVEKLRNFQFPGENMKLAMSAPRQPLAEELEWLAKWDRAPQGVSAVARAAEVQAQLFTRLDPSSILREFGIRTADELAWWSQVAATTRSSKEEQYGSASEGEHSDDDLA
jgi:hypothetical protein